MADTPNILLIMSDQHSPRFLGCAEDEVVRTPTLDRLAEGGVRFANNHCANPLCVPSRMTFLTSRHSSDIRVWTNRCRLQSDIPTFVHHLVNAGYETTLCGRMHFNGPDQRHGFERRIIGDISPQLGHIPSYTAGQTAAGVSRLRVPDAPPTPVMMKMSRRLDATFWNRWTKIRGIGPSL